MACPFSTSVSRENHEREKEEKKEGNTQQTTNSFWALWEPAKLAKEKE